MDPGTPWQPVGPRGWVPGNPWPPGPWRLPSCARKRNDGDDKGDDADDGDDNASDGDDDDDGGGGGGGAVAVALQVTRGGGCGHLARQIIFKMVSVGFGIMCPTFDSLMVAAQKRHPLAAN